jgi:hypothetical protein
MIAACRSGLTGSPATNYNYYSRVSGTCQFRDGRPGTPLAAGNLAQWRSAQSVDAMSVEGALTLAADGRLLPASQARNLGLSLPEVSDDIDREQRTGPVDIGADEFGLVDAIYRNGFE